MKILFTYLFLLTSCHIFSQSCVLENIIFNRQSQVDSFNIQYPGCTIIEGNVEIYFNEALLSIDSLQQIKIVNGNVLVRSSTHLFSGIDSLHAFPNLEEISGDLRFYFVGNLRALTGFDSLKHIGGDLRFDYVLPLTTFNALTKLETIGQNLTLKFCNTPGNNFLPNLRSVAGNFFIEGDNKSLLGFDSLRSVGGNFSLWGLWQLSAISTFPNFEHLGGDFQLIQSLSTPYHDGFPKLKIIPGNMSVYGVFTDSISGFKALDSIGGKLEVNGHDTLRFISAFDRVRYIGQNLVIKNNALLEKLDFPNLENSSFTNVEISNNGLLSTITGFESITKVDGKVQITNNVNLKQIGFFPFLTSCNSLSITDNYGLLDMTGLQKLETVNQNVLIRANTRLQSLDGLENLRTIKGKFEIIQNDSLHVLSLESLDTILDVFLIEKNELLTEFHFSDHLFVKKRFTLDGNNSVITFPYNGVVGPKYFDIKNNPQLVTISTPLGMQYLPNVNIINNDNLININIPIRAMDDMNIIDNDVLTHFEGLDSLELIENLLIDGNKSLKNLSGFESLTSILFTLQIINNDSIVDFTGFAGESSPFLGRVIIEDNPSLKTFKGMENIDYITELVIANDHNLESLVGLSGLDNVRYLRIRENDLLASLDGLESLALISNILELKNNPLLEDISGIRNAFIDTHHGSSIEIKHNPKLSACAIESICEYFLNSDHQTIDSNAIGCNSVPEVEAQCLTSTSRELIEALSIYPNPVTNELFSSNHGAGGTFKIYSIIGDQVLQGPWTGSIQVDHLPTGLYILILQLGETTHSNRFYKY